MTTPHDQKLARDLGAAPAVQPLPPTQPVGQGPVYDPTRPYTPPPPLVEVEYKEVDDPQPSHFRPVGRTNPVNWTQPQSGGTYPSRAAVPPPPPSIPPAQPVYGNGGNNPPPSNNGDWRDRFRAKNNEGEKGMPKWLGGLIGTLIGLFVLVAILWFFVIPWWNDHVGVSEAERNERKVAEAKAFLTASAGGVPETSTPNGTPRPTGTPRATPTLGLPTITPTPAGNAQQTPAAPNGNGNGNAANPNGNGTGNSGGNALMNPGNQPGVGGDGQVTVATNPGNQDGQNNANSGQISDMKITARNQTGDNVISLTDLQVSYIQFTWGELPRKGLKVQLSNRQLLLAYSGPWANADWGPNPGIYYDYTASANQEVTLQYADTVFIINLDKAHADVVAQLRSETQKVNHEPTKVRNLNKLSAQSLNQVTVVTYRDAIKEQLTKNFKGCNFGRYTDIFDGELALRDQGCVSVYEFGKVAQTNRTVLVPGGGFVLGVTWGAVYVAYNDQTVTRKVIIPEAYLIQVYAENQKDYFATDRRNFKLAGQNNEKQDITVKFQ